LRSHRAIILSEAAIALQLYLTDFVIGRTLPRPTPGRSQRTNVAPLEAAYD
jgi:hypothetical protein